MGHPKIPNKSTLLSVGKTPEFFDLKKQIPEGVWEHDKIDNNADSHIKSTLLGPGQVIPVENGELLLGTWQGIALAEFGGPKRRKIIVRIL